MRVDELKPVPGSNKRRKRVGRGTSGRPPVVVPKASNHAVAARLLGASKVARCLSSSVYQS
jgi:hypothetical protein